MPRRSTELVYRPHDVGDAIEAGGVIGSVNQMNLVSTMIMTFDNQLLVVPNNKIWGDVIRNITHQETRRIDMTFGIAYSDDIAKAEQVLQRLLGRLLGHGPPGEAPLRRGGHFNPVPPARRARLS